MTVTDIPWTSERIEKLEALWDEGVSTAEMGRILGVTKNVVIGRVHRLGLLPRRVSSNAVAAINRSEKHAGWLQQLGGCAWPHGDPREPDFHFCGSQRHTGRPYCREHCGQAYDGFNPNTVPAGTTSPLIPCSVMKPTRTRDHPKLNAASARHREAMRGK